MQLRPRNRPPTSPLNLKSSKPTSPTTPKPSPPNAATPLTPISPNGKASISPAQRKRVKYVHAPGSTPFPDHLHPKPEECRHVERLLTSAHGESVRPPEMIINNSVSGCGEVPKVLDALIRTVLSANTSNANSAKAFQGLLGRFGVEKKDKKKIANMEINSVRKGENIAGVKEEEEGDVESTDIDTRIVDWDAVRRAPRSELYESIKHGGLADMKSKTIKTILEEVWEEGKQRLQSQQQKPHSPPPSPSNCKDSDGELSLEYIRDLDDEAVRARLTAFKGVGQKTASCVLLFCLQRESFAVDTHVFRLSKFLNWVPANATRETAYYHLDTRIPNQLKYPLHNLLIRHGRTCRHCKAGPPAKTPTTPKPLKRKKGQEASMEDGENRKKMRKVWVGNGMMKEVLVEFDTDGEGGEQEHEKCVLENLMNRVRKERRAKPSR